MASFLLHTASVGIPATFVPPCLASLMTFELAQGCDWGMVGVILGVLPVSQTKTLLLAYSDMVTIETDKKKIPGITWTDFLKLVLITFPNDWLSRTVCGQWQKKKMKEETCGRNISDTFPELQLKHCLLSAPLWLVGNMTLITLTVAGWQRAFQK